MLDIVDGVATLGMNSRTKRMSTPAAESVKTERSLKALLDEAEALNGTAGQLKKAFKGGRALRRSHKTSLYARALRRLGRSLDALASEIDEKASSTSAAEKQGSGNSAAQPASVRAKLDSMVKSRELLASAEFASELDWSRQALSNALARNRVFYVDHRGERFFPAFYTNATYQRSKLEAVSKVLGDLPGGAKLQFFLTPRGSLDGVSPLQALAQGKLQKVKALAEDFALGV